MKFGTLKWVLLTPSIWVINFKKAKILFFKKSVLKIFKTLFLLLEIRYNDVLVTINIL
jgi:hypothetical protein